MFLLASLLAFFFGSGTHAQEKLGRVTFPTSCSPKVQVRINRAVAMLHSFWFQQGEKAFREVLEHDPRKKRGKRSSEGA
jgi:hypothetical protein